MRLPRYGTRSLLAFVTLVGIALAVCFEAWPAFRKHLARQRLVAAVEACDDSAFLTAVAEIEALQPVRAGDDSSQRDAEIAYPAYQRLFVADRAVPRLLELARHDNPDVRTFAAIALGLVRPDSDEVVTRLIELVEGDDDRARIAAAWALPAFGERAARATPVIRRQYRDSTGYIRLRLLMALVCEANADRPIRDWVIDGHYVQVDALTAGDDASMWLNSAYPERFVDSFLAQIYGQAYDSKRRALLIAIEESATSVELDALLAELTQLDNEHRAAVADGHLESSRGLRPRVAATETQPD